MVDTVIFKFTKVLDEILYKVCRDKYLCNSCKAPVKHNGYIIMDSYRAT